MASRRSIAFCRALFNETAGRVNRYASIASIAGRLGLGQEEAEALAAELDDAGMVRRSLDKLSLRIPPCAGPITA